jgi:hypothetical protein
MNSNFRFTSVAFLTAIYCFAIGVVTKSLTYSDFKGNSTTSQEQYLSNFSTKLLCHTPQSESSVNNYNSPSASSFKNPFNGLWAICKTTEQLFETAFSQYTNISENFLIQHRKADIIFPFHYFW